MKKSEIEKLLNSKETYLKVLEILSAKTDLDHIKSISPYIAGGSVANTIISFVHGGQPVINDIDVYRKTTNWDGKVSPEQIHFSSDGFEFIDDHYGRIYTSNRGASVSVVSHIREGILNIIDFNFTERGSGEQPLPVIVDGFDLNCCMAGLDLEKEEILFSKSFIDYLETKQLKVVNSNSPIQTSIRLFKKIEDLNCFCNVEHEMRFLTATQKWIKGSKEVTQFLGPETLAKYETYKDKVSKYFVIRNLEESDFIFQYQKSSPPENIMTFDSVMPFNTVEQVNNIREMKRIWYLLYTPKTKSEQNKINKIFYKNVFTGNDKEDNWYKVASVKNGMNYDSGYYSNRFTCRMLLTKKDYHKCNFDLKHVMFVDKFISEHNQIWSLLGYFDTLAEQYQVIKAIKAVANKEGDWIIGSLENYNWFNYFKDREKKVLTKEEIQKIVDKTKLDDSKCLVEKLDISGFEYSGCVTELNTTLDLKKEGYKMGHCVGGYSTTVSSGYSRIFHIDCDGIGSTVEVSLPETKLWSKAYKTVEGKISAELAFEWVEKKIESIYQSFDKKKCFAVDENGESTEIANYKVIFNCKQHFGRYPEKGNKQPTDTNKMIVNKLIEYLNQNHLPKSYNISFENLDCTEKSHIFV